MYVPQNDIQSILPTLKNEISKLLSKTFKVVSDYKPKDKINIHMLTLIGHK